MYNKEFVIGEFLLFSIQAGFSTRNEDYPIYNIQTVDFSFIAARRLKKDLREILLSNYMKIKDEQINEGEHIKRID